MLCDKLFNNPGQSEFLITDISIEIGFCKSIISWSEFDNEFIDGLTKL